VEINISIVRLSWICEPTMLPLMAECEMNFEVAPYGRRIAAAVVDMSIVTLLWFVISFGFAALGLVMATYFMSGSLADIDPSDLSLSEWGMVAMFVSIFVLVVAGVSHGYFIYFECKNGCTPGKKIFGLKVVSVGHEKLSKTQVVSRDLARWYIDGFFLVPALVAMVATKKRQRVGDLIANTMVVCADSSLRRDVEHVKR
jgi:uncharacterized RDD family membrane protein YckC